MSDTFTRTLTVSKDQKHKQSIGSLWLYPSPTERNPDVRLLDGDTAVYGIIHGDKGKIAEIVKFENGGDKVLLAEVEWIGDKKDKIKFPGGNWQNVADAWEHYDVTKDREPFLASFTGADGRKYIWHLQGSMKVLSVGDKNGPVIAKHSEQGTTGSIDLTSTAISAGEMLFITFLAAEGYRGRWHFSWFQAMNVPGMTL